MELLAETNLLSPSKFPLFRNPNFHESAKSAKFGKGIKGPWGSHEPITPFPGRINALTDPRPSEPEVKGCSLEPKLPENPSGNKLSGTCLAGWNTALGNNLPRN